jgi:hypothetical protein
MIQYLGSIITSDVIDRATITRKNKVQGWKYGYDPELDLIVVSKDGTLGEIYYVNGLRIGLPAVPEDKTKIINHDLPKYEQKWKREQLPEGLTADTEHDPRFADFIISQFTKRHEGVWIYIKGKPLYITGSYWYTLQNVPLDEGYGSFRVIQNDLMLYWEACKADRRCYGIIYVKNRRFGWTSLTNGEILCEGTQTENALCGMISKTGEDAKSMFSKLVRGFKKLPSYFMPIWDGSSAPKKVLNLTEPSKRSAAGGRAVRTDQEGLNTEIKYYATVLNAMDGEKVFRSAIDEGGKWPKDVPFDKYWPIVKTSHRIGARIVGKAMIGSTMNAKSEGGAEFKVVYDQSDPLERNDNGQTGSGLYKLFIDAAYCIEGFFDEYGYSIVEDPTEPVRNEFGDMQTIGAITFLDNESKALKAMDEATYYENLRQFPRTEEHAFRDKASDCDFDLPKLIDQIEYNENELDPSLIQRGNFSWKDGLQDTEVEWIPNPNGRFYLTWQGLPEYRNKWDWVMEHGIRAKKPRAGHLGSLASDPYNRSTTVDGRGSMGSIHGQTKGVMMEGVPSDFFFLEYIDRPKTVELFFEDVIMAMVYFSMPVLLELSNEKFLTVLRDRGYRWFCMNRPDKTWNDLSPTEKEFGGAPAQGQKIGEAQFYAVEAFINNHVGTETRTDENKRYRNFGEIGKKMYFNRTLYQWKDVDTTKRTKFDAYISSSLVLIANQRRTVVQQTMETELFSLPISMFDNSGNRSKRL